MQGAKPLTDFGAAHQGMQKRFPEKSLYSFLLLQMAKKKTSQNCDELYWKILPL